MPGIGEQGPEPDAGAALPERRQQQGRHVQVASSSRGQVDVIID